MIMDNGTIFTWQKSSVIWLFPWCCRGMKKFRVQITLFQLEYFWSLLPMWFFLCKEAWEFLPQFIVGYNYIIVVRFLDIFQLTPACFNFPTIFAPKLLSLRVCVFGAVFKLFKKGTGAIMLPSWFDHINQIRFMNPRVFEPEFPLERSLFVAL